VSRLKRALQALSEWCRKNLHLPVKEQYQKLTEKLRGHYGYYGITGNYRSLQSCREATRWIWKRHLSRRRRGKPMTWSSFARLEERYRLPAARVIHSIFGRRSDVIRWRAGCVLDAQARICGNPGRATALGDPARNPSWRPRNPVASPERGVSARERLG